MSKTRLKTSLKAGLALVSLIFASVLTPCNAGAQETYFTINGQRVSPEEAQGYQLLQQSVPLLNTGRNQEAVAMLQQASQLAPNVAEIHNNLGLGLAKLGRTDEAQTELEIATRLKPTLDVAWMSLGGLYQTQGKIKKSLETYGEFVSRFPGHPDVSKVKAIINGMNKEIAEGVLSAEEVSAPADNYLKELKGQIMKWPASRMPIKVFIASGAGVPGYKLSFDSVLRQSFAEWAEASGGLVSFQFVPNQAAANLVCTWTNDPTSMKNTAEAGETNVSADRQGIVQGSIKFLTVPLVQALPVTDNFLKQTCLHEIGHALGFGGHTNNKSDTMFFTIRFSDQPPSLSARDKRSIQLLYEGNITQ